jgi:serine/threonine protein kinase/dipeptidyl aminopeptidase/acylaminoacyl peptidase
MPSLREEITKTFTRLAELGDLAQGRDISTAGPDSREGRTFGNYQILHRVGSGGMGQVYLALDTRLDRRVALKFLPPDLVADNISLLRLVQEARTASALNHPNILTIYDVGELEGEHFIVSEFVDGITLRTAIEQHAISPAAAIEIACQVASALDAAHRAGVVHRDLKPTNIMLRPDGYVKVIDFGLAKRLAPSSNETQVMELAITRPGTTVGTAAYMSPEQARAEEVDFRTDLWSLGVILFEMLVGQRPFLGVTASHVLVAVQDQPLPPLPKDKGEFPPGSDRILQRALAKDSKDRYESAGEMVRDLQTAIGLSPSASRVRGVFANQDRAHPRRGLRIVIATCFALAAVGLVLFFSWSARHVSWLRLEPVRQLTFNGRTQLATISPDGRYLAYTVGQADGEQALFLKQIDSSNDDPKIPPRGVSYKGLSFTPDSQTLYLVEKENGGIGKLFALPLLGQRPRIPILIHIDGPISFSPNGEEMAYVNAERMTQKLFVSSRDGQRTRVLLRVSDAVMLLRPAWSPDGKRIAVMLFRDHPDGTGEAILDLVNLNGTESRRVVPGWERIGHLRWTPDGKSILTDVGAYLDPYRLRIHQVSIATGADQVLTNDLASYFDVSLTASGTELTAIKRDAKAVLWVAKADDLSHGSTTPAQSEFDPSLSWMDEQHLIVDSRRNGFANLAVFDVPAQTFSSFTNEQHAEQAGVAIPGTTGKSVVFASNRSGEFHIWRFDSDANQYRQLTFGSTYDEHPAVSPDGLWVIYTSWSRGVPRLMNVPAAGGQAVPLGSFEAKNPEVSPDGKWVACYLEDPVLGKGLAIVPRDGSAPPTILLPSVTPFHWAPNGKSLTIVQTTANGVSNLWNLPVEGGAPVPLTHFDDQTIIGLAWSPSGQQLACLRETVGSDVALFNGRK